MVIFSVTDLTFMDYGLRLATCVTPIQEIYVQPGYKLNKLIIRV